jgi:hypothetical protein
MSSWVSTTVVALALFAIGAFSSPGYAQVKPGDFITPENATKVKDLVGPGVYYKVERGMSMKIVPTQRVDWPPPYKDATEKYSAQVRLSQDKRSIVGFVAGQPFPLIDANDPEVAVKIVWNNVFRPITSDDYDLRFYDCDSEYEKKGPRPVRSNTSRSVTTPVTISSDALKSSRSRPIPISRRPAATGCSASIRSSRRRKFAEPDSSDGVTPIQNVAMISGASAPVRAASAASTSRS